MFKRPETTRSDHALREGLHQLPVPNTSADFANRIYAALHQPVPAAPKPLNLWSMARPILLPAACSLMLTLALLPRLTQTPAIAHVAAGSASPNAITLERFADRADLAEASLRGLPPVRPLSNSRRNRHGNTRTL